MLCLSAVTLGCWFPREFSRITRACLYISIAPDKFPCDSKTCPTELYVAATAIWAPPRHFISISSAFWNRSRALCGGFRDFFQCFPCSYNLPRCFPNLGISLRFLHSSHTDLELSRSFQGLFWRLPCCYKYPPPLDVSVAAGPPKWI